MSFKIGDRVMVKGWNQMVKEFGVDWDCISIPFGFTDNMKYMCNKTGTIADITQDHPGVQSNRDHYEIKFDDKSIDQYCWVLSYLALEKIEKEFTKADIKTGMRIKLSNGDLYLVIKGCETKNYGKADVMANFNQNGFMLLDDYNDDLSFKDNKRVQGFEIVEVFSENDQAEYVSSQILNKDRCFSIWKKPETFKQDEFKCESCGSKCECKKDKEEDEFDLDDFIINSLLNFLGFEDECDFVDEDKINEDENNDEELNEEDFDELLDMLLSMFSSLEVK